MDKVTTSTVVSTATSQPNLTKLNSDYDPEWDKAVAAISQHCRQNGLYARTLIKGGSFIVKERRR